MNEIEWLPFKESLYVRDRASWIRDMESSFVPARNGFWYAWYEFGSQISAYYVPLTSLPFWGRRFDVVLAGAIVEHLANPVVVINNLAALTNEALILAFTLVGDSDDQVMQTANDWSNPKDCRTWWTLSRGLYRRIFDNLGFDVTIVRARALANGRLVHRPTIVATRRSASRLAG